MDICFQCVANAFASYASTYIYIFFFVGYSFARVGVKKKLSCKKHAHNQTTRHCFKCEKIFPMLLLWQPHRLQLLFFSIRFFSFSLFCGAFSVFLSINVIVDIHDKYTCGVDCSVYSSPNRVAIPIITYAFTRSLFHSFPFLRIAHTITDSLLLTYNRAFTSRALSVENYYI